MLEYLKAESNKTFTENGAVTKKTTDSDVLDLFSTVGALRNATEKEIIKRFIRAFTEDSDLAMKVLFFARDIRGGLGERRVFRIALRWLAKNKTQTVIKNMGIIEEYGRYDDYLTLLDTKCQDQVIEYLKQQLKDDVSRLENNEVVSLLAKWLPSVNASNTQTVKQANTLIKGFGMTCSEYRKTLSALRKRIDLVENRLRQEDYTFAYEAVPSRAQYKYRNAFIRNDKKRYQKYIEAVNKGETSMHADNIAPYELITPFLCRRDGLTDEEKQMLNAAWNSLPDYGGNENTLAVIDTSGSMYGWQEPVPAAVALSLGLYFATHNKGAFKNYFIEFSEKPQLIKIKGRTFADKLQYILTFEEIADTNLEAVFRLILDTAVKYQVPKEELPAKLVIISDMEFNSCVEDAEETNFQNAKRNFELHGYKLPEIIFWNVASRNRQQPVTMNEQGVALVSGCSVNLFKMIAGGNFSPYEFMMNVLQSERYAKITA